jgi:hypothetical protein
MMEQKNTFTEETESLTLCGVKALGLFFNPGFFLKLQQGYP